MARLPPPDSERPQARLEDESNDLLSGHRSNYEGTEFGYIRNDPNESTESSILRLIRDQTNAARVRFNRLGKTSGALQSDLAAAVNPLQDQLARTDGIGNLLAGLTGKLVSSSLGSTAGAGIAAANAARLSGGGRFGGGGNAAMMAARGAVDASVGQSAALSQALVQGQLGEANFQSGILQQRGGIAAALSQLLQSQAGLKEDRGKLGVAMETEHANILSNALGVYGGIREAREGKDPKAKAPSLLGLI